MIKIYYLYKGDGIPFYIGKTQNSKQRLTTHRNKRGKSTFMEIIDEVSINEWRFWEIYYISLFKSWGFILTNKNKGGGGFDKMDQNTKDKISKSKLGYIQSEETRFKRSIAMKNIPFSDEHKSKIKLTRGFLKGRQSPWNYKPILQYDMKENFIKEWPSQMEAFKSFDRTTKGDGIGACCRGEQKSAFGYIWKFKE